jgi:hypothetical protein
MDEMTVNPQDVIRRLSRRIGELEVEKAALESILDNMRTKQSEEDPGDDVAE